MINKILGYFGYELKRKTYPQQKPWSRDYDSLTLEVKKLLLEKRIRIKDLAKEFGCSSSMISQAFGARRDQFPDFRIKIYEYLKSL